MSLVSWTRKVVQNLTEMIQHCVIIGHIIGGNAEDLYCVDEYVFSIFDFSLSYCPCVGGKIDFSIVFLYSRTIVSDSFALQ